MATVKQVSAMPTRKVSGAGIGAVLGTLAAAAMSASGTPALLTFINYPGIEAAMGGLFAFIAAYVVKERA